MSFAEPASLNDLEPAFMNLSASILPNPSGNHLHSTSQALKNGRHWFILILDKVIDLAPMSEIDTAGRSLKSWGRKAAPMKIALPAPHEILSPLKSADLLAAQEHAPSATPWWLKILNAISEGRLPFCYQNGEPVATSDFCGIKDIRDPHFLSRDLGAWLADLGYTVVFERISNDRMPDGLSQAI